MAKAIFNNTDNSFYQSLKAAVDKYFQDKKIRKTGNWNLYLKTIILVSVAIGIYCSLLFIKMNAWPALALCIMFGITCACIGFGVMHDACHGSYSSKTWVNNLFGLSLNALGSSSFFWKQKHNIIHHTYTNVDGIDDDIAKSPIMRQCESQKWVPAHRVQHLYLPFIYALATIFWLFVMDPTKYFSRKIYTTEAWKMSTKNHIVFWATKILYILFYMVLPALVWGWKGWLLGYFVTNAAMGFSLSIVFQLAHVVENTAFEHVSLDESKNIETAWAEFQIKTTSNFAMNNKVISWLVGGLNFQVEHHLFPRVSHIHYPAISKIVQKECAAHGLVYNYYSTMTKAVISHFKVMRFLGKKPVQLV